MFWKRKKKRGEGFWCEECGEYHESWPALVFKSPFYYSTLSKEEKSSIGKLSSDFCEIHHADQIVRFIRGILFQKVIDYPHDLDYGLWVSLSEKSYADYKENFKSKSHEAQYFGWLANDILAYESTLSIPTTVVTQTDNQRPLIFPHRSFDHPFVKDFYEGITKKEAEIRIDTMLNK